MIELVKSGNIQFLLEKEFVPEQQYRPELTSLYSAGEVYISPIIDILTCQTYYNPHLLTVL